MSSRKNVLHKFQSVTNGDMSGSLTSKVTNILHFDNVGIQLNWSGTPTGTFSVQVSIDYDQDALGNVTSAGNWVNLVLSPPISASGVADKAYVDLNQLSAPWIRITYTPTSGAGTLNAFVNGKQA